MGQLNNVEDSNRDLIHILNGRKLYIASLLEDKARPQHENQRMHADKGHHKVDDASLGKPLPHPEAKPRVEIEPLTANQVCPRASGVADIAGIDLLHGGEAVINGDTTLPQLSGDDISPQ